MHKYDKRFTGGNQLAYQSRKIGWFALGNWKTYRRKIHELRKTVDEDQWEVVLSKCEKLRKVFDYD